MASVTETTTDLDLVGPFVRSTQEVFETMLSSDCRAGDAKRVESGHHMQAVTAVIGLSGGIVGAISISTSEATACELLKHMTGLETDEVDEFVRDVVGEISNMVAGKGKRELSHLALDLGLPQVIVGEDYTVYSPRWAQHLWIPLQTDLGDCTLDIGFDTHRQK